MKKVMAIWMVMALLCMPVLALAEQVEAPVTVDWTALVVAVGCTGGHHRSVAIAHALAAYIRGRGYPVTESHRDLGRT